MFKLQRKSTAATEAIEYIIGTDGEAVVVGELLKLAAGKLTKASGTDVPEFVALGAGTGTVIPVKRIYEDEVYQTVLAVDGASLKVGDRVTTDGLKATATTASGVFMITEILGTEAGAKVNGMFRR